MGSFSTSLSGLSGEEQVSSVISNDLANLNTTAFKSGTPFFSDLFYQMLGTGRARAGAEWIGAGTNTALLNGFNGTRSSRGRGMSSLVTPSGTSPQCFNCDCLRHLDCAHTPAVSESRHY